MTRIERLGEVEILIDVYVTMIVEPKDGKELCQAVHMVQALRTLRETIIKTIGEKGNVDK